MPELFHLEVVTQDHTVYSGEVASLVAPGAEGYLGVLAHHAPMVVALQPGELRFTGPEGVEQIYAVSGGFLQVSANQAIVLADTAELPAEIDIERARAAVARAEQRLQETSGEIDVDRARAALMRAVNRLHVAERYRGR